MALLVLAWGHHVAGDSERAASYAEQSLPIARSLGDRVVEGMGLLALAFALQATEQPGRSLAHATQCLWMARASGDRRIEGYALLLLSERDSGEDHIALALETAIEIGDRRLEGNAYLYLAIGSRGRGAWRESLSFAERALVIAEETRDRALGSHSLIALGIAQGALREPQRAIDTLQRALEAAREIGNPRQLAIASWLLDSAREAFRRDAPTIGS
jgi:tetratricopeptide (TPR) repeat protein